jgi:hypothetical protein
MRLLFSHVLRQKPSADHMQGMLDSRHSAEVPMLGQVFWQAPWANEHVPEAWQLALLVAL